MESEVWSNNNDSFKQLPFNKWCQLPVVQEIPDAESLPRKEELISAITFHSSARGLWAGLGKNDKPAG